MTRAPAVWVTLVAGLYASIGGAITLVGWFADIVRLVDWSGNGISMKGNTAACSMLAGLALTMLAVGARHRMVRILGCVVASVGFLTLLEHVTGINFGIDTLLVDEAPGARATAAPSRMGPPASLSWTLLGTGLVFATVRERRLRWWAATSPLFIIAMSLVNLMGQVFDARPLFDVARLTGMAAQTATMVLAAAVGLMAAIPEHGLVATLTRNDPGGAVFRRMLPPIVAIPMLLGWLRVVGQKKGFYETGFGVAVFALSMLGCLLGLLWWTAESTSRSEAAKKKAQQFLTRIIDHAPICIAVLKGETLEYVSVNRAYEAIMGPGEGIVGRRYREVFPQAAERGAERSLLDVMRTGQPWHVRDFHTHITGREEVTWWDGECLPLSNEHGETDSVLVLTWEVTEHKARERALRESEQRFRNIFDTVAVSLWEEDFSRVKSAIDALAAAGVRDFQSYFAEHPEFVTEAMTMIRVLDVNDATVKMFEARDKQELLGSLPKIFAAESAHAFAGELVALAEGRTYFEAEAMLHTVRGNPIYAFFTMVLPSDGAPFDRVLFSVIDLSERRRAEQQIRNALDDAQRASRLKDEFLATLSHELRTPMSAIVGWANVLRRRAQPSDAASGLMHGLEVIERNAKIQAQIIEDLLDMSRIIAGKVRLDLRTVEISLVLQAAIEAVRPTAEVKAIRLEGVIDADVPEIRGDPARLQQVVYNLLSNAVKFTPTGGTVRIACGRVDSHVEISVSDNGIGIEPEFLPHVFERFRQQDASSTRSHGGLGLGLGIVKELVELHGGRVYVASNGNGQGAQFTVHLPLAVSPPLAPDLAFSRESLRRGAVPDSPAAGGDADLVGLKVLVVDDEPDARDLLRTMLQEHNATVELASSAQEAMRALEQFHPDVLLSDIGMPGEDGYALIRRVRDLAPESVRKIPAIALTAFARSEDRTRAMREGFDSHLSKPIEEGELVASVVAATRYRSTRDAAKPMRNGFAREERG